MHLLEIFGFKHKKAIIHASYNNWLIPAGQGRNDWLAVRKNDDGTWLHQFGFIGEKGVKPKSTNDINSVLKNYEASEADLTGQDVRGRVKRVDDASWVVYPGPFKLGKLKISREGNRYLLKSRDYGGNSIESPENLDHILGDFGLSLKDLGVNNA